MINEIEILGITPVISFPKCPPCFSSNQICETDILCIPVQKPPIESILQVKVNISVCSYKVICTPVGEKLVIEGVKHINIIYVADVPCQSVHSAHFNIPFCMFVLLNEINCKVIDVFTAIEDIKVKQLDCRCFSVSVIIFACPEYKSESNHCRHEKHHCNNSCNDDCESNCCEYRCKEYDDCESNYYEYGCKEHDDCESNCCEYRCKEHDDCESNCHEYRCKEYDDCESNCCEYRCKEHDDCESNYYKYRSKEEDEYASNCYKYKSKKHKNFSSGFDNDFLYLSRQ